MNNTWVAALLTPSGMSAIAVIGVRGAASLNRLASRLTLRRAKSLQQLEVHVIAVADFRHGDGAVEEVVVFRTAIDSLEIHCHGGRVAADSILGSITALDGTVITASQWAHQTETCPLRARHSSPSHKLAHRSLRASSSTNRAARCAPKLSKPSKSSPSKTHSPLTLASSS